MHQSGTSFTAPPHLRVSPAPATVGTGTMAPVAGLPHFDTGGLDPAAVSLSRLQHLVDILDRYLRLPNDFRTFSLYLAGLILVFAGATLHVLLAAEILQAKVQNRRLEQELALVQQQNGDLLWQIARETNLNELRGRIEAMGYVPVTDRAYVTIPEAPAPLAAYPATTALPESPPVETVQVETAPPAPAQQPWAAAPNHWRAWEEFIAFRWTSAQTTPIRTERSQVADQWLHWWQQNLDHSAVALHEFRTR